MTDEQINAAIAKACGWTNVGECENGGFRLRGFPPNRYEAHRKPIPDYCNDLNAMHEAEKVLDEQQLEKYSEMLMAWYGTNCGVRARADQRAEAFLRTLGKWEDAE